MTTLIATLDAFHCDTHCTSNSGPNFRTPKAFRVDGPNGPLLVGGAGDIADVVFVRDLLTALPLDKLSLMWLTDGWPPAIIEKMESDVVVSDGETLWLIDQRLVPLELLADWYVLGSGAEAANVALNYGDDPHEALYRASQVDPLTQTPFLTVNLHG